MRIGLAVLFSMLLAASSISAYAAGDAGPQPATTTISTSLFSSYLYPEVGQVFWNNPVARTDITRTDGNWSYDLWTSTQLSGHGPYGHRGAGDEIDLTAAYSGTVDSFIGPLTLTGSAAYWLLDDFSNVNDDTVAAYADMGRSFSIGNASITPYVRLTQWEGLGAAIDKTLLGAGIRFVVPLGDGFSANGTASVTHDLTDHRSVPWFDASVTKDLGENWSLGVEGTIASGAPFSAGLIISKQL